LFYEEVLRPDAVARLVARKTNHYEQKHTKDPKDASEPLRVSLGVPGALDDVL
jgi:hypothetical protein